MLSYETGGITLRNNDNNNNNNNGGYSISQQQPLAQAIQNNNNQSIANVPRRVPGAPPKRRVPGAPPVKKNIISLNNSNQQGNITIPNNIENMNANSINKNPILRKTLGSLAQRAQQPKRRVPGAPSENQSGQYIS